MQKYGGFYITCKIDSRIFVYPYKLGREDYAIKLVTYVYEYSTSKIYAITQMKQYASYATGHTSKRGAAKWAY